MRPPGRARPQQGEADAGFDPSCARYRSISFRFAQLGLAAERCSFGVAGPFLCAPPVITIAKAQQATSVTKNNVKRNTIGGRAPRRQVHLAALLARSRSVLGNSSPCVSRVKFTNIRTMLGSDEVNSFFMCRRTRRMLTSPRVTGSLMDISVIKGRFSRPPPPGVMVQRTSPR